MSPIWSEGSKTNATTGLMFTRPEHAAPNRQMKRVETGDERRRRVQIELERGLSHEPVQIAPARTGGVVKVALIVAAVEARTAIVRHAEREIFRDPEVEVHGRRERIEHALIVADVHVDHRRARGRAGELDAALGQDVAALGVELSSCRRGGESEERGSEETYDDTACHGARDSNIIVLVDWKRDDAWQKCFARTRQVDLCS